MVVIRNNPYINLNIYQSIPKRERIVTNKQACEQYEKIMKQKTKTFTK